MNHPSSYCSDLTQERLVFLAQKIQEQVDLTYDTNSEEHDGPYTQGSVIFGRLLKMITGMCLLRSPEWMSLAKLGNDLLFNIGKVPCRFATDNPDAPRKTHILEQSPNEKILYDQLALPFEGDAWMMQGEKPVKWRWVIQKVYNDIDAPSVHLLGLNEFDKIICRWDYKKQVPSIYLVDGTTPSSKPSSPAAVNVPAAPVKIKAVKSDGAGFVNNSNINKRKDE